EGIIRRLAVFMLGSLGHGRLLFVDEAVAVLVARCDERIGIGQMGLVGTPPTRDIQVEIPVRRKP
ncbi:MAG TPA: hypothetical protein VKI17_04415, partial [Gemmataceae bacterium]|nr:hypothetical protein [Gemmataceae bacterium]